MLSTLFKDTTSELACLFSHMKERLSMIDRNFTKRKCGNFAEHNAKYLAWIFPTVTEKL